ncbi:hypothetical protein JWG42_15080 [Desulfoprunum benzoelyticum]|uniref:Uncharacterized protein n=1 Tax=Desulfoprunum benzoelyticum TaxID=1506996 RepID=A0A840V3U6_9BACT|nr:hypothetical protein [Desulfoprunum benzoelyticum]MBB5349468.1 hypothetical protein [Desulfoprunum benzoelyticum]MBM9531482.1 hypothetical protein [Desulfoprunum benzoelyticum]
MRRRTVHQWKDWLLEYIGDDRYELLNLHTRSLQTVVAKNAMDAENQCRQIMIKLQEEEV